MRYAIISDVHANLDALDAVVADARAAGVEKFVCLGDSVGYGPLPAQTISRLRDIGAMTVAGNHDDAVSGRIGADGFIDLAGDAVERHRQSLGQNEVDWLKSLGYVLEVDGFVAVHGDLVDPGNFRYIDNPQAARLNFSATGSSLVFVGHTHCPGVFLVGGSGRVYQLDPVDFIMEEGKRYIVNPGSVGYPRESGGVCRSSYVIYDSRTRSVCFRFLPFSVSSLIQRGRARRRIPGWMLLFFAGIVACILSVAGYLLVSSRDADVEERVIKREEITVRDGSREICFNLQLEKDSVPVELSCRFLSGEGRLIGTRQFAVKKSSSRPYEIPEGTQKIDLKVLRLDAGENPRVKSFLPELKRKQRQHGF